MIEYKQFNISRLEEVKAIYAEQGWTAYLMDDDKLVRAFENSLYLYGAFDEDKLIGFVRCVGDGEHILLVQDLIVRTAYQKHGIGTALLQHVFGRFAQVRMVSLYTDSADHRANSFYRKVGMKPVEETGCISYMR